jgi:hypothetical protein
MSGAEVAEFLGSPVLTNILLVIVVLFLFLRGWGARLQRALINQKAIAERDRNG